MTTISQNVRRTGIQFQAFCGPRQYHNPDMSRVRDYSGKKFNSLTVISYAYFDGELHRWNVICECGRKFLMASSKVSYGKQKSCGCLAIGAHKKSVTTHGQSRAINSRPTRIYTTWVSMIDRCANPDSSSWKNYGARGIKVCAEWLSFETFYADMGDPAPGMSIDRIDVNGNYEKSNCRWATVKEQANNRRTNRFIEHNGLTRTVSEWAEVLHLTKNTLLGRLNRGMSAERALTAGDMRADPMRRKREGV